MNILAIDTSTRTLSLALAKNDQVVTYRNEALNRRMADAMMPRVVRFLEKNGLNLKKIDAYIVGLGPGSFTGLRVGLAAVKGMAFGLDTPVIGISSLDAIAGTVGATDSEICVITDAKRGLLYCARYEWRDDRPERVGDYQLKPWAEIKKETKKPVVFAGDGVDLHHKEIIAAFGKPAVLSGSKYRLPQARFLARLGWAILQAGGHDDIAALEPLYLYAEDCQVRK